jgi:hypothetical protein
MARTLSLPFLIGPLALIFAIGCTPAAKPGAAPTTTAADSSSPPAMITAPAANGQQVIPLDDGGRMEGMMKNGTRVGPWASYFKDNTLRSRITYVDGVEEGPTEVNHPNGMPYYVGSYLHGKNFGEWVFYNERGDELKRVTYDSTGVIIRR